MKKTALKLIPAVAMLLVSAIMVSTATFAWFSMNTTVEASGMQLTAVTPVNLLICETNSATESDWSNSIEFDVDQFGTGKLYPASTADATTFNAIENTGNYIGSGAGGVAENSTSFQATSVITNSGAIAENVDGYFAVYNFYIKLSEAQTGTTNVYLSNLNVVQTDGTGNIVPAVRFAVFANDTLKRIYAPNGADASYTAVSGSVSEGDLYSAIVAASQTTAMVSSTGAAPTNYRTAVANGDITENENDYIVLPAESAAAVAIKVVVWIEGQDTHCNNNVTGNAFSIDFDFAIAD